MNKFIAAGFGLVLTVGVCPGAGDGLQAFRHSHEQAINRGPQKTVKAVGIIQAEEEIDIGPQVAGVIQKLGTDPKDKNKTIGFNTTVKKDTILVQLDPARYEAKLAIARANLQKADASFQLALAKATLAELELKRMKKRQADKTADSSDVEIAKAALDVAKATVDVKKAAVGQSKAALEDAELDLSYCTIRSPIDGIVLDRHCNVGQTVVPSLTSSGLFLLARDLKKLQLWALVREADVGVVATGQLARFTVASYTKETFQGRVAQIRLNATAEKGMVTYTVVIDVDNSDGKLLPYMSAHVSIEVGKQP
jgi:HlyD family secretion protein